MVLFRIGGGNEEEKWMDICNYFRKRWITFPRTSSVSFNTPVLCGSKRLQDIEQIESLFLCSCGKTQLSFNSISFCNWNLPSKHKIVLLFLSQFKIRFSVARSLFNPTSQQQKTAILSVSSDFALERKLNLFFLNTLSIHV